MRPTALTSLSRRENEIMIRCLPTAAAVLLMLPAAARSAPPLHLDGERPLFDRVAVLGASLTAGYGLNSELQARVELATVLECALQVDPGEVFSASDLWFFTNTQELGRKFIDSLKEHRPSLVFALDFLFWYPFGPERREQDRMQELEVGLSLLEELDATLVLADFPNISSALKGKGPFGGPLVTEDLLPEEETRAALNRRLYEWAAERPGVVIIPMDSFSARLHRGEALQVGENTWPEGSLATLVQEDLLHTTAEGSIALLMLALHTLRQSGVELPESVQENATSVRGCLLDRTKEQRERAEARARNRAERRKAREKAGAGDR